MQNDGYLPLFGYKNKITITKYIKDVDITFNVFTNKQEEFRNNNIGVSNYNGINLYRNIYIYIYIYIHIHTHTYIHVYIGD